MEVDLERKGSRGRAVRSGGRGDCAQGVLYESIIYFQLIKKAVLPILFPQSMIFHDLLSSEFNRINFISS